MKVNEVRIGNLIKLDEVIHKVNHYDIANIQKAELAGKDLSGFYSRIKLTEEWLVEFGFKKYPNQKKYDMDDFWACELRNGNEWHFEDLEVIVYYVHQLQNLYFSLTGKELD